jgi:hypothetical protein
MRISVTTVFVLVVALLAVSAEAGQLSESSGAGEHPSILLHILAKPCCWRMAAANADLQAALTTACMPD